MKQTLLEQANKMMSRFLLLGLSFTKKKVTVIKMFYVEVHGSKRSKEIGSYLIL